MCPTEDLVLSKDESRSIDEAAISQLGLTGPLLMENAARGVVDVLLREFPELNSRDGLKKETGRILVVCGTGNNGGDGLAIARQLAAIGVNSDVYLMKAGKQLSADCEFNLNVLLACGISVVNIDEPNVICDRIERALEVDLVVDCLLGTGLRGVARSPFVEIINAINSSAARVLSVDVPSGLDCESGLMEGECVQADVTVTFCGRKQAFDNPQSSQFTGKVFVAHIGLPLAWLIDWLIALRKRS